MKKLVRVSCAVIINDGKFLIAQRSKGMDMSEKWEFPGGKIEANESAEQCIIREISEELNVKISISQALQSVHHEYETFTLILFPFIAEIVKGVVAPSEHKSVLFCSLENLRSYDFSEADKLIISQIESIL